MVSVVIGVFSFPHRDNVMEDICSKLQEIRNPIHAIGLVIREMDYETEVEMEKGFNPGK